MMEKGKISSFQMGIMMYPTILATAVLIVPGITAKYAKNDLWLSPILASIVGFITVFIAYQLHKHYPNQTLIQYSELIVGKFFGKVLGFIYVFFYLHVNGIILREYAEFLIGAFLPQTPISVVISSMMLVCAFAVRGGVEVVGRSAQLFIPIFLIPPILMIIFLYPELEPKNILPIMEHGIIPSLKGAMAPQAWFSEFILISFLLPFLSDVEKGRKWGMISVFAIMLTLVFMNLLSLFLFGEDAATLLYPVMSAAKYISVADFFENLESVVMAMWVVGAFIKISVFFYATVLGTAQWLSLSDYRPVILPLGFLTILFSFWDLPNFPELVHLLDITFPFYGTMIQTVIPMILLLINFIRKRNQ